MKYAIKYVLEETGMSQKELAEKLYVTPQAVSKWIHGESIPSGDNIKRICELTGINVVEKATLNRQKKEMLKTMKDKTLTEIDDYTKAGKEAEELLVSADIRGNYSYAVYKLCSWLLPAVIGLTYHQMRMHKSEEIEYGCIFSNLLDYFDDNLDVKMDGLYENYLEYSFYIMGMDLFELFDVYNNPDVVYCDAAMADWCRFQKALIKDNSSPVYNELLVAITEIIELNQ